MRKVVKGGTAGTCIVLVATDGLTQDIGEAADSGALPCCFDERGVHRGGRWSSERSLSLVLRFGFAVAGTKGRRADHADRRLTVYEHSERQY